MVLINELTVEQINAALLHLQRSKDEVVGGNKGTTIQNITISNSGGGGNNVDYSGTIKNLATNIEKNKTAIEKNASDISKLKSDMANIEKSVEDTLQGLADNGISDLSFDPLTKQLTITTNDGDTYQTVIEQDIGYLSYDSATNKLILTTGNQTQEITLPYIKTSEKGSANGVATLDENGRVPYSQLPESAMEFLGQWDASTNTPHLTDGTGTNGDFYIVSAGGTVNLGTEQDPHIVTFSVNDRIVYEGDIAQWVRLPAGQVSSVNGQSGEVTLTASDIEYSTGVSIKAKIDANAVQADWNVTDTTSLAYIKNKPTIPSSPVQSDWNVTDTTSLAYIKNKPSVAVLGNTSGCALGTASAGSCTTAARSDHVHPLPTLVTCSCYSNQLHGCLANYNCGLQLAVTNSSIDMYQKQGDTSKNVNINVNGGICQVSLYNGTLNALGTLRIGELNSLGYVTASTGFRSGTGNGYFYTSDGNTLNYSSNYAHMWLNYRGGTSIVHIGSGVADGCHGILCAKAFCGSMVCASCFGNITVCATSGSYVEGIRLVRASSGWSTLLIGASDGTSGACGGFWIGNNISTLGNKLYVSYNASRTDSYFCCEDSTGKTYWHGNVCGTASCAFISSWSPQMILDDNVSYDVPFVAFSPVASSDRNILGLSTGRKIRYNPSTCTLCVPNICATNITAEAPDWKKLVCSCCGSSIWKIQPHMYYAEICGCCIRHCDLYKLFCSVIVACADSRWVNSGCGRWVTAFMGQWVRDCGVACSYWGELSALFINTSYLGLYCNNDNRVFTACYNCCTYLSQSSTSYNMHGYFTM